MGNRESRNSTKLHCGPRYILPSTRLGRPGCIFADTPISAPRLWYCQGCGTVRGTVPKHSGSRYIIGVLRSRVYSSRFWIVPGVYDHLCTLVALAFFNTRLAACSIEKWQSAIILWNEVCYLPRNSCKQDETLAAMKFVRVYLGHRKIQAQAKEKPPH